MCDRVLCLNSAWNADSKLDGNCVVVRVHKQEITDFNPRFPEEPPITLFRLTPEDYEQARKTEKQPLLSTWDESIPFLELINKLPNGSIKKRASYSIPVGRVHEIVKPPFPQSVPVEVHKDVLIEDPHGSLHSGIQGVCKPSGIEKKHFDNIKFELARLCKLKDVET